MVSMKLSVMPIVRLVVLTNIAVEHFTERVTDESHKSSSDAFRNLCCGYCSISTSCLCQDLETSVGAFTTVCQ